MFSEVPFVLFGKITLLITLLSLHAVGIGGLGNISLMVIRTPKLSKKKKKYELTLACVRTVRFWRKCGNLKRIISYVAWLLCLSLCGELIVSYIPLLLHKIIQ